MRDAGTIEPHSDVDSVEFESPGPRSAYGMLSPWTSVACQCYGRKEEVGEDAENGLSCDTALRKFQGEGIHASTLTVFRCRTCVGGKKNDSCHKKS